MRKSQGHITFTATAELYEQDGEVYKAPLSNAFDLDGRRHGRWECSRSHFDRYRDVIISGPRPTSTSCDSCGATFAYDGEVLCPTCKSR
jgi:hypothetical protein